MSWFLLVLVRVYRAVLSPMHRALFGPCCRFEPTLLGLRRGGDLHARRASRGAWLAARRLAALPSVRARGLRPGAGAAAAARRRGADGLNMEKRVIVAIALCVGVLIVVDAAVPADRRRRRPPPAAPVAGQNTPAPAPGTAAAAGAGRARPRRRRGTRRGAGHQSARAAGRAARRPTCASCSPAWAGRWCTRSCARSSSSTSPRDPTSGHDVVRTHDGQDAPLRTTFPESGVRDAGRRRLGGEPAGARHGRVRGRQRQRPHREALPRRHDALPAAPGRGASPTAASAGRAQPGAVASTGRQDPEQARRRVLLGPASANVVVGALLRQRQASSASRSRGCAKDADRQGRATITLDGGRREVLPAGGGALSRDAGAATAPARRTSLGHGRRGR